VLQQICEAHALLGREASERLFLGGDVFLVREIRPSARRIATERQRK